MIRLIQFIENDFEILLSGLSGLILDLADGPKNKSYHMAHIIWVILYDSNALSDISIWKAIEEHWVNLSYHKAGFWFNSQLDEWFLQQPIRDQALIWNPRKLEQRILVGLDLLHSIYKFVLILAVRLKWATPDDSYFITDARP